MVHVNHLFAQIKFQLQHFFKFVWFASRYLLIILWVYRNHSKMPDDLIFKRARFNVIFFINDYTRMFSGMVLSFSTPNSFELELIVFCIHYLFATL